MRSKPLPRLTVGPLTVDGLAELGLLPKPETRALSNNGYRKRVASPVAKAHDRRVGVSGTQPHETARLPLTPVAAGPSQPRVESARMNTE